MSTDKPVSPRGRRLEMVRLALASRRINDVKSFWIHAIVFALVMPLLFVVNYATFDGDWWVQWPLLGWGIGLACHAIAVYGLGSWLSPSWEEKKISELMDKEKSTR